MSYIEPEQNQVTDFLNHRNFLVKHKLSFPSLNPDQVMDFDVVFVLWSDGKETHGKDWTRIRPQSSLSYLDRTRVVTQLSRRGRNSRSVTEESARRDGGRGKPHHSLRARAQLGRNNLLSSYLLSRFIVGMSPPVFRCLPLRLSLSQFNIFIEGHRL